MGRLPGTGPQANTNTGPVEGFVYRNERGEDVNVYLGIPYAQPPVGDLRFELPQPARAWSGTFSAKAYGNAPVPFHPRGTKVKYAEDCLTVHVMCPPERRKDGYPTVFFIHPSAYCIGSVMWNRFEGFCENFVPKGMVVVMCHYRLGFLGFASTGDATMPGNLGLHDQAMALRWTAENVQHFGGRADDITAWGISTGGVSAGLLSISPKTRHYIRRTIQNSGSIYCAFAMGENVVQETFRLAKALGLRTDNYRTMKEELKKVSVEDLHRAQDMVGSANPAFTLKWVPRLDGDLFPNDLPALLKESPPLPTLCGCTTDEFIYFYDGLLDVVHSFNITAEQKASFDQDEFIDRIRTVHFTEQDFGPEAGLIAERVVDHFARQNVPPNADSAFFLARDCQIMSHLRVMVPMFVEYNERHRNGSPVFVYQNAHWRNEHFTDDQLLRGCMHVSEMKQFFNTPLPTNYNMNGQDLKHKKALIDSHVNFILTENPSFDGVKWPRISDIQPFVNVTLLPESRMSAVFERDQQHLMFWLEMIRDFGLKIVRTRQPLARFETYSQARVKL